MIEISKLGGFGFTIAWEVHEHKVSFRAYAIIADSMTDEHGQVDPRPLYHRRGAEDGMDMTFEMSEADVYMAGNVKWDGCSEVTFGEDEDGLHLCGRGCWSDHVRLVAHIWHRAGELMQRVEDFKPLTLASEEA